MPILGVEARGSSEAPTFARAAPSCREDPACWLLRLCVGLQASGFCSLCHTWVVLSGGISHQDTTRNPTTIFSTQTKRGVRVGEAASPSPPASLFLPGWPRRARRTVAGLEGPEQCGAPVFFASSNLNVGGGGRPGETR